ncbi:MAG: Holliday junction resolvase RuvX [Rhodospirillales bacterium]|nr:Holliday junction resolvase RuvX [Rhodospirillales bacterium]
MSALDVRRLAAIIAPPSRLLGLDVGAKTIGCAVSDATWSVATPITTLRRTRLARDLDSLCQLVAEREVGGFVIGLPVEMDGNEGRRCQSVRQFARDLSRAVSLPLAFWDERLSTTAVERTLIGEADLSRKRRSAVVDRAAAAWILQGALDAIRLAVARGDAATPDE